MKRFVLLAIAAAPLFAGCLDDDDCPSGNDTVSSTLITPDLDIKLSSTQDPMTGILEAYPCEDGNSNYFGNYIDNKLTPFPGYYRLRDGDIYGKSNRFVTLPVGVYNMIYWGTAKPDMPIYSEPAVTDPQITLGGDLSKQYFGLRKVLSDTTYYPTFDFVYAVKSIDIGVEELSASMRRVVAGLQVIVKNKDNSKLSATIADMEVQIGSIAEKINFYTAEPENFTRTVEFPLTASADGTQMSNDAVMIFPSGPKPMLTLLINLKNGNVKTFRQALDSPLKANNHLVLTLTLGDIFSDQNSGTFTVDSWQEVHQTIDVPTLE